MHAEGGLAGENDKGMIFGVVRMHQVLAAIGVDLDSYAEIVGPSAGIGSDPLLQQLGP